MIARDTPLSREAAEDPFSPPEEPVQVQCLHCGLEYSSSEIVWRDGFWRCPTPGCGGAGFTFDIFPVGTFDGEGDEDEFELEVDDEDELVGGSDDDEDL